VNPASEEVWVRCEPWLRAAMAYDTGERSIAEIRRDWQAGAFTLYAGRRSAMLTENRRVEGIDLTHLYLIGGELGSAESLREVCQVLRPRAEDDAWRAKSAAVAITGRKGWARAFRPFGYMLAQQLPYPDSWVVLKMAPGGVGNGQ